MKKLLIISLLLALSFSVFSQKKKAKYYQEEYDTVVAFITKNFNAIQNLRPDSLIVLSGLHRVCDDLIEVIYDGAPYIPQYSAIKIGMTIQMHEHGGKKLNTAYYDAKDIRNLISSIQEAKNVKKFERLKKKLIKSINESVFIKKRQTQITQ